MNCTVCDKPLSSGNVTGLCRRHVMGLAHKPEVRARSNAALSAFLRANPEIALARVTRASHARLAWCPPEYRGEYRRLTRSKMLRAAEARQVIEDLIATHAERYRRTGQLQQAA